MSKILINFQKYTSLQQRKSKRDRQMRIWRRFKTVTMTTIVTEFVLNHPLSHYDNLLAQ